jgi:hypothetical protein
MNTAFQIGQQVIVKHERQGLVKDRTYRVVDIDVRYFRGLTYVTYELESSVAGEPLLSVGNGHLILAAV